MVLSGDTLVITLHEALTAAEKALASTASGSAEIQEFHKKLFDTSSAEFRQIIKEIVGFDVREARTEVCSSTGTVVQVFSSGTVVQVYLLANGVPTDTWKQNEHGERF